MPKLHVNGVELYYENRGSGAESVVFAHGLLCNVRLFDQQVAALLDRYRCIAFDFRGHGQSAVTWSGYDMDTLTEDTAGLIRELGAGPCHFLGLSMGGFIGMRLAIRYPELVRSLMLLSTSADEEPPENLFGYKLMAFIARWISMRLVGGRLKDIMFGKKFQTDPARAAEREEWRQRFLSNSRVGASRAAKGVFSRAPVYDEIGSIRVPTLVMVGDEDVATPPLKAQRIHERIAGSRLVVIPGSGHTVTVEEPAAVNTALMEFLSGMKEEG
jgi:pimeloyl-ACP methyl ester carboxylesterase